MPVSRRQFVLKSAVAAAGLPLFPLVSHNKHHLGDRCEGLLVGSLLGDAMGGPLEFAKEDKRKGRVVNARAWKEGKRLDEATIKKIADDATLMGYAEVRPDTAAYGPWIEKAPAGTVTDDSRWKIILIRAIRRANKEGSKTLTRTHIAKEICQFSPRIDRSPDEATQNLVEEGMREYRYAANWILGERDPSIALPLDRLWAGIPNCSGQMMLLPLAIRHAGDPEAAYRESFEVNFIDAAGAKDIAASIVAALSSVIGSDANRLGVEDRWDTFYQTMQSLDPLRFKDVPFAARPLDKWLTLVDSIVERSDGSPTTAFRLLETEAKPVYYWEAHFTLVVALTLLKLCRYDAMCALSLAIDFGHDTDSYAQLIGAIAGAVCGVEVFPKAMRQTLALRLKEDYGETVSDWLSVLSPQKP